MYTNQSNPKNQKYYMGLALFYANKALGNTKKNPAVGCVVIKNGTMISAGHTSVNGRPHAEFNALNKKKISYKDSELYVTLEPCSHYGLTPPCINSIIKKKIKKVYFSIKDFDQRSFNKSSKLLKKNGIAVKSGILNRKVNSFYRSYKKNKEEDFPFLTFKLAISKDFYSINKKKKWITNYFSRGRVHLLRSYHDAILTSSSTINIDNPKLNCRIEGLNKKSPVRIVLDKNLKTNISSVIYNDQKKQKTIVFYNTIDKKKIYKFKNKGVKVYKILIDKKGNLNLREVLKKIKKLGFCRVFLECGVNLGISFIKEGLIDDFKLFVSNKKLGSLGRGSTKKLFKSFLMGKKKVIEKVNLFGEKLLTYKLQ